jgi:glycogen debranching enzyme
MHDSPDTATVLDKKIVLFRDTGNPWFCVIGSDVPPTEVNTGESLHIPQPTVGQGATARFVVALPADGDQANTVTFFVAGSSASEQDALAAYCRIRLETAALLAAKRTRYAQIAETCHLTSPDTAVNAAFQWAKLNCQMLARATTTHGIAVGAGLPTYPWWFGIDAEYAALPMAQTGQFDLLKATLALLKDTSDRHNAAEPGRVIHELSTTGVVYNPGNLIETPAFVRAVHQLWLWTGDREFLTAMYPFCKAGILDYTLGHCDPDGDLCASGSSIIETPEMAANLEYIDVAAYTWDALTRLADMAEAIGDADGVADYQAKAMALGRCIRREWWLDHEGLFADARASIREINGVLAHIAQQARTTDAPDFQRQAQKAHDVLTPELARYAGQAPDMDLPWLLRHWIVLCPIEVGLATREQAARALARLTSAEFCNAWGMRLHPERDDVMSINTGLLTLALTRYGDVDAALRFVRQQAAALSLHMPGAISEALPDRWCFLQLWSALGVISPVIEGFLGIAPRAAERRLAVIPNLPTGWERVTLERVHVGEAQFDIAVERSATHYRVAVTGTEDFQVRIGAYFPAAARIVEARLNDRLAEWRWEDSLAGHRIVCEAMTPAVLCVHYSMV